MTKGGGAGHTGSLPDHAIPNIALRRQQALRRAFGRHPLRGRRTTAGRQAKPVTGSPVTGERNMKRQAAIRGGATRQAGLRCKEERYWLGPARTICPGRASDWILRRGRPNYLQDEPAALLQPSATYPTGCEQFGADPPNPGAQYCIKNTHQGRPRSA